MKIVHYVPPLVALIIAAAWLASLRASNRALEQDNRSIQAKIAESRGSLASQNERAGMGVKSDRTRASSARAKRETKPADVEVKPLSEFMPTASDFNELVLLNNHEGVRFNQSSEGWYHVWKTVVLIPTIKAPCDVGVWSVRARLDFSY